MEMVHPSKIFEDLEAEGGPENTYVGELSSPATGACTPAKPL